MENNIIIENDLAVAWARVFLRVMEPGVNLYDPVIVIIESNEDGKISEENNIRSSLNQELDKIGKKINSSANTIFPNSMWNPKAGRDQIFDRYLKAWRRIRKHRINRMGVYFHRLIAYENDSETVNQLDHIIKIWNSGTRRYSALQASIFDPRSDHTNTPMRGFPCLQQVAFNPIGPHGVNGLDVIGFYPTQYIFERAYGNYLGLCNLGLFMAYEMNLKFRRLVCVVSRMNIGNSNKSDLRNLEASIKTILKKRVD